VIFGHMTTAHYCTHSTYEVTTIIWP